MRDSAVAAFARTRGIGQHTRVLANAATAESRAAIDIESEHTLTMGNLIWTMGRRWLLLAALMFWQGGFTFYGAVVVPVGSEFLGSHQAQGWITRSVTNYLNLAGMVALGIWALDIATASEPAVWRYRIRWTLWTVLLLALGLQGWLHLRLDDLLDLDLFRIVDRPHFRILHKWYLLVSTVQWGGSLLLVAVTLLTWRAEDRRVMPFQAIKPEG
jgi:hypothetical protein